jgi:NAD(P)H-hydrate epimerase
MEYVTPQEMRDAEARAGTYGLGPSDLMENAGAAVAKVVEERYARTGRGNVLVVCGLGNNGGDGLVAARHLASGWRVRVLLLGSAAGLKTSEAARNWARLRAPVETAEVLDQQSLMAHREWFASSDVILDAILGTGVKGDVREPVASAVRLMNDTGSAKVAIDVPSGLDPLTGAASAATVRADLTITLHRAKVGMRGKAEYTGEVLAVPIGIRE